MNKCTRYALLQIFLLILPTHLKGSLAAKAATGGMTLGGGISMLFFGLPYILVGALLNPPVQKNAKQATSQTVTESTSSEKTPELSQTKEPATQEVAPVTVSPIILPAVKLPYKGRRRNNEPLDYPIRSSIKPLPVQPIIPLNIPQTVQTIIDVLPKKTDQPVFINLNLNNQQALTTTQSSTESSADNAPIITTTQTPITLPQPREISHSITSQTQSLSPLKLFLQKTGSALSWIGSHKVRFISYCCIGAYGSIYLYLWHAFSRLTQPNCWSLWKSICSLPELYQTNKDDLIAAMKDTLKETFKSDNELLNGERFIKEAGEELTLLKRYKSSLAALSQWYLTKLFFLQKLPIEHIIERIHRLEFMQKIINEWLLETKRKCTYDSLFCRR